MERRSPGAPGRWWVLAAFALLVVTTQLLWLTFSTITPQTARHLGVSEGAVGDLAVVNPAMFVILAIPAGRWMDRRYGATLAAGAVFTAVGACVRFLDPSSYSVLLVGQVVMSVGQPLTLNATTKIAARYFRPDEQTNAIAVASAAQFVGILAAVLSSSVLVDAGGFGLLLGVHAVIAVLAAVAVLISLRVSPLLSTTSSESGSLVWLRSDSLTWRQAALLFVGFGSYNGLATWLDSIMTDFGHPRAAGGILAAMTVAGIAGAAVIPGIAAARDTRRAVCIASTVLLAAALLLATVVHNPWVVGVALAVAGFVLLGNLPVVLDWSELHVGAARAGTATGFLLLCGNLGGVLVVLTVQAAIGSAVAALVVLAAWAVPGLLFALSLPRRAGVHPAESPSPTRT